MNWPSVINRHTDQLLLTIAPHSLSVNTQRPIVCVFMHISSQPCFIDASLRVWAAVCIFLLNN